MEHFVPGLCRHLCRTLLHAPLVVYHHVALTCRAPAIDMEIFYLKPLSNASRVWQVLRDRTSSVSAPDAHERDRKHSPVASPTLSNANHLCEVLIPRCKASIYTVCMSEMARCMFFLDTHDTVGGKLTTRRHPTELPNPANCWLRIAQHSL
jgi:hypothetical protein